MNNFTKGEWQTWTFPESQACHVVLKTGRLLARIEGQDSLSWEERVANAKLISAAPEMYKALEEIIAATGMMDVKVSMNLHRALYHGSQAMSKAEGKVTP